MIATLLAAFGLAALWVLLGPLPEPPSETVETDDLRAFRERVNSEEYGRSLKSHG